MQGFKIQAVVCASLFFGIAVFMPHGVFGAPTYTVTPLVIDEDLEARDIVVRDITITNTGTQAVTVYPSVNNIALDDGGGITEFVAPVMSDRTTSLASWLEISRAGVKLMPGEVKTVALTIRVNPSPVPGEYHALVGFGYGRTRYDAEQLVKNGKAPGVVVTVNIEDKKNEYLRLSRFIIDQFVTSTGNEGATYTIKNPGDTPLMPRGEIIIYDKRGREIGTLPVNPDGATIPPGEEQAFAAEVPVDGLFGKYKAFLSVEYGASQVASVQDTTFFYVLPLKQLLIIFGVLAVVVVLISLYVHRRYFGETDIDGADAVPLYIKDTLSENKDHDLDLKQK